MTTHSRHEIPDAEDDLVCPVPCATCDELGPGGCEDCLDCLLWPEVLPPRGTPTFAPLPGPTAPVWTEELAEQRSLLDLGARVGLVSRRHRRTHRLSQRALAGQLGWSQASVNRAEHDATPLTVRRVEHFLDHLGYRLAIVPAALPLAIALGEDPDTAWGTPDLLARDGGGRRLPPYGRVTWNSVIDRRLYARVVKHEAEWTWHRPGPHIS